MLLFSSVPQSTITHKQDKGIVEVAVCLFFLIQIQLKSIYVYNYVYYTRITYLLHEYTCKSEL